MKPILRGRLACPRCKADVSVTDADIRCARCPATYPIARGVPILTPTGRFDPVPSPPLRDGYDPWIHRRTLGSLLAASDGGAAMLDLGSGNMRLDLPGLIRMDFTLTEHVDIVADAHHLPFRADALDMVFSLSVLEHLRQPFDVAEEMYRILKPGGYVYHDTNFVFPYHGYPHHYFNFSPQGLQQVFHRFRALREGIAPYHMPSVTVDAITRSYVRTFLGLRRRPRSLVRRLGDLAALSLLYAVGAQRLWARYDEWFEDQAYILAAGTYWYGVKQPGGHETVIPARVLEAYRSRPELQRELPEPLDLSERDNVITRVLGVDPDAPFQASARYVEMDAMRRAQQAKGVDALRAYLLGRPWRPR